MLVAERTSVVDSTEFYEIERGKPIPSKNHGRVQSNLIIELGRRYKDRFDIISELSLKLITRGSTPDICLYAKQPVDWLHDITKMTEPPLLAIEILSSQQGLDDVVQKIEDYFKDGVKSCWLVQPVLQTVTVFTSDMEKQVYVKGDIRDDVLNIAIPLAEVFD